MRYLAAETRNCLAGCGENVFCRELRCGEIKVGFFYLEREVMCTVGMVSLVRFEIEFLYFGVNDTFILILSFSGLGIFNESYYKKLDGLQI